MKFSNLVILTATVMVATSTWAQQETQAPVGNSSTPGGVVILNTNSNSNTNTSASTATAQPTTVVEASALADGKAEALRKARQNAEVQTEQKIVERLEDSRLDDEQRRAERLFGDRMNSNENVNATSAAATATTVAPATQAVPVQAAPAVVNIEKIEIVQPAAQPVAQPAVQAPVTPVTEVAPAVVAPAVVAPAVIAEPVKGETAEKIEKPVVADALYNRMYVGFGIGSSNYYANNVDSSYSIGVSVGKQTSLKWAFEGFFNYSNHNVDTFWQAPLYREMNQYDFGGAGKYIFTNRGTWKPYVGGQAMFIYRTYTDRIMDGCVPGCANAGLADESVTYAMNLGPNIGMDFEVNRQFAVGAEFMYNFNFVNKRDINYAQYGVPSGTKPLEEISYYTLQITAKMSF